MRSNSLDLAGDLLVVAYQTARVGLEPAGFEIFDVGDPGRPRSVAFFDASGPHSRGVHHLWFVDGSYVHLSGGAADFTPRNPKDDQCYRIVDVREPTRPTEVGRWWLPGTRDGDAEPPPVRHTVLDSGFRAHNTNVYPRRPDRAWVGYLDGGAIVLDIADMARPRLVSRWDYHPPFPGFTHTLLPLFDRGLLIVSDEAIADGGRDWPKLVWVVDARDESNLVPIATCPVAARRRVRRTRRALWRAQPARESPGPGVVGVGDDHRRQLLQWRCPRLRPVGPVPARGGRRTSSPRRRADRAPAPRRSTTCSWTSAA